MSENVLEVTDSNFESEVLGSKTPVLVDFWAPWCGPCRMLAPTLDALAKDFDGTVRVVKLNVDDNPATSQRFGIKGIPTLILFQNGTEEERIVGVSGKENIAQMLRKRAGAATA